MSTFATSLRDAIADRLGKKLDIEVRKVAVPQLQPDDLPAVTVFTIAETSRPDGDSNAGEIRLITTPVIAISLVRGFDETSALDGSIDADLDAIREALFTDPSFTSFSAGLFESVEQVVTRRLFPQQGETYLVELRLEITFLIREFFEPVTPDDYAGATVTVRPIQNPGAPPITAHWDEPND